MENIIDLIATDASPSDVSDQIKSALYAKSAERIDALRPFVASSLFGADEQVEDSPESQEDQE